RDAHGPASDAPAATVPAPGRRSGGRAAAALARRRRRGFLGVVRRRRGTSLSMGLRAWLRTVCCCCCPCGCLEEPAVPEKEPLVRWVRAPAAIWSFLAVAGRRGVRILVCSSELGTDNPYSSFGATLARDDEKNLWSVPHDVSHTEADDDRILYNLIVVRNQQAKDSEEDELISIAIKLEFLVSSKYPVPGYLLSHGYYTVLFTALEGDAPFDGFAIGETAQKDSEESYEWKWQQLEWQKLNYDIYTLRQIRREVRNRWKRILEDLGFQKEVDSLLSVTKLSTISDSRNTREAREILLRLAEETNIFPTSWELSERYLFVVDRLIALDAAEEFFKVASQTYPKKPGVPCQADGQKGLHYLPFPNGHSFNLAENLQFEPPWMLAAITSVGRRDVGGLMRSFISCQVTTNCKGKGKHSSVERVKEQLLKVFRGFYKAALKMKGLPNAITYEHWTKSPQTVETY
ncbi:hypothetical protein EI555_005084, partial [Monodon monoceros]